MRTIIGSITLTCLIATAAVEANPGSALVAGPAVVRMAQPVRVEMTSTGYQVFLSHKAATNLSESLGRVENEESLGDLVKQLSTLERLDENTQLRLELLSLVLAKQLPAFKQSLAKNIGENGAVITVVGIEQAPKKERPLLKLIGGRVMQRLPEDMQQKASNALAMARTAVVYWTVSPIRGVAPDR